MILADTSIWVDHLRLSNQKLRELLLEEQIVMHPYVVAELALGSMRQRAMKLRDLDDLPSMVVANMDEVRQLIEKRSLYNRGIGFVDAHLIASSLLEPGTRLWTLDKRLGAVAEELGILAQLR